MADRYWVGGSANWDATAGTKWATTSGGAGGASVPTSADDVFFDAASGAVTCTVSSAVCRSVICTGFTGTIAGSGSFTIHGALTLVAGMTWTNTSLLGFSAASGSFTVTTAGKTVGACAFGISTSTTTWTLGDALTSSGAITVTGGTFTTNNYNVTATSLSSSNSNTRTINLGSSTVTLSGSGASVWSTSTTTGLTFNAGTSTVALSNAASSITLAGGGITFYNVSISGAGTNTLAVTGANTFNNFSVTGPASAGVRQVTFDSRQTINGTLSTTGTAGNRRVWFRGATYGIAQTLTINSAPSLTDADFRDIYVVGTAAPISGTRIGDLRGCRGITFSTPKTVYWNLAGAQSWSANGWTDTSTGTPSTDFFPLAQDTATFTNAGSVTGLITMDGSITYTGTIDLSGRTSAMNLAVAAYSIYGNITLGSGVTLSGTNAFTLSGRNTQTITSAGKTFTCPITVDSYGGTVQLADALNIGANTLTVTNGTFDTKNYNVTAGSLSSSNSNVRTITLGSSTVTLSAISTHNLATSTNLTFNAGTSTIVIQGLSGTTLAGPTTGPAITFYDVSFIPPTTSASMTPTITGSCVFNNLLYTAHTSASVISAIIGGNQTITGTLTVAGASPVRRIFLRSDTLGTTRTLTVNSLSATDCDFRDITIAGTAAGSSPTRAGDCGGNTGITFPAPKTVYWNLSTASTWFGIGWCSASGGTPDVNNFPLAQDTAVFDDAGSATDVNPNVVCNIGTINASARTTSINMQFGACSIYGNVTLSSAITIVSSGTGPTFSGRGTQTITSNGRTFNNPITIDCFTGTVQLADALTLAGNRTLTLTTGTFDAVTYNVTTGLFSFSGNILKMGSGTWTLSGTGLVWFASTSGTTFYKGTANIVLSDTSTSARSFSGGNLSYNKLTIGGTTGISTLTINDDNQFTELASTKTVAHTIALGTTTQTFGAWTVTGTVGNVVTLTGTGTSHILAGACTSGIDYLAMGSIGFAATSPGEFYAGANSTGTAGAPVYRTAKPADSTRYWVGGTGNWSDTARWSASSGGASGASVPRSHDDVVFNSASNATAYTATVNAVTGGIRMKSLTIAGPASGNLTLAGTTAMVGIHGNVTLPATGLTRTYTGDITLASSSTGRTITTNGVSLASNIAVNGVGCEWSLGSAFTSTGTFFTVTNGSINFSSYNCTLNVLQSDNGNKRTVNFGTATTTLTASAALEFGTTENARADLNVVANTSQITFSQASASLSGNGKTFYNVSFTNTSSTSFNVSGNNTFNNLTFAGLVSANVLGIFFIDNQTISGTLTFSPGTNATMRTFVRSGTIGTPRTLTCNAVASLTDVDFRDITIAGAAAPVSGTRLGDCKGNSGITFDAAKTVYWRGGTGTFGAANWSNTSGGSTNTIYFPLAQDTAIFNDANVTTGATATVNASYNLGTIDMSGLTSNTMTLATGSTTPAIYGNWINGTGTTLTGTGVMTFAGRGSQTITSAGKTFTQGFTINTPGGSVTFQDNFTVNTTSTFTHTAGTLDGNGYNVTLSNSSNAFLATGSGTRTLAIGSGTWTFAGTGTNAFNAGTSTNLTVTGTGTISLTAATSKSFQGGSANYSGITLNQGGAGTLTISGNNTFKDITNTYSATGAATIAMGTTTQTVTQWTATGTSGKVLTVQGTSASSPATLVLTGGTDPAVDYLAITGVRAYSLTDTWYAGANSTNNGSLGWYFESGVVAITATVTETASGSDVVQVVASIFNPAVSETAAGADSVLSRVIFQGTINEVGTASDLISALKFQLAQITESANGSDTISAFQGFASAFSDTVSGTDSVSAKYTAQASVSETASLADVINGGLFFLGQISESASAADVLVAAKAYFAAIADGASIADAVAVAASTFNATASDTAAVTDSISTRATFISNTTDTATGTDTVAPRYIANPVILESGTGADTFAASQSFSTQILEAGTGADTVTVAPSVFNAPVVEISTIADASIVAPSVFNAPVVETVVLSDAVIGAFLWNLINDAQTPDWQNISTTQSVTWTVVDDSQTPNWQNINTLN